MTEMKYRTFQFALSIGKLVLDLPLNPINKPYIAEGDEILKIIVASINTTRKRLSGQDNSA